MMIVSTTPKTERKKLRKNKATVSENAPLLPKTQESDAGLMISMELHSREQFFNLSTTIIGAGIMALLATLRELGMLPGLAFIVFMALLIEKSIEFLIRFTRAGKVVSYGGLMGDSFGKYGKALVQLCVIINNIGVLIVYMIIIGDVLSGTSASGEHHSGILEGWFSAHWTIWFAWNLIAAGYVEQSVYGEDRADITANSLHSGTIATNLFRHMGVANGIVNAIGRLVLKIVQQGVSGKYFSDSNMSKIISHGTDANLAKKLWDFSMNLIK
ncbi:hypothetical protein HN51_051935 [Arachis hypogaea]